MVASLLEPERHQRELEQMVQAALDAARRLGAEQAEVAASMDRGLSVTARLGELESVERTGDRAIAISVYRDGRKGSASTAELSKDAVERVVAQAASIARFTAADPCAGLADPQRMAIDPPDLDLFHPWDVTVERAEQLALAAEGAGRGSSDKITNSEGASVSTNAGIRVYGNSHGFLAGYPSSSHSISCTLVGEQGGAMERDYWYTVSRTPDELTEAEAVGLKAAERVVRRLGARSLSTTSVPVVFPPELARGLFGHLTAALLGGAQYRRASFLLDAVGEPLFPAGVTIREEPHLPRAMGSASFDNEGVATVGSDLVAEGVLKRYLLSSYAARKLGLETTGNAGGVHNLIVEPTVDVGLEGLLGDLDQGFLVSELMGQGVNTVTGDYSRGASGFWVERGEIAFPVNEVTVAGNLRQMFAGLRQIGSDVDRRSGVHVGSVVVNELTIAGRD